MNEDEEAGDNEGDSEDDEDEDDEEEEEEEEDPEDHQDILREKCNELSVCAALKEEFDICETRVNSRLKTEENCAQELLDFIGCVDKCVSTLFLVGIIIGENKNLNLLLKITVYCIIDDVTPCCPLCLK